MKKFLFICLLSIFLTGCNNQNATETNDTFVSESKEIATVSPIETKIESDIIEVVGAYNYYIETDNSASAYKKSALNRVCFEPAQLETVNNGQLFCFRNTHEALKILKLEEIDYECKKYWGVVEIKIKNLSKKNRIIYKGDLCMQDGSCEFEEAELIEVTKFYYDDEPHCEK